MGLATEARDPPVVSTCNEKVKKEKLPVVMQNQLVLFEAAALKADETAHGEKISFIHQMLECLCFHTVPPHAFPLLEVGGGYNIYYVTN